MTLFSRYVFRQVANAFVIILVTLTSIVWIATALKQLDLLISQGQGFELFLKMTFLSLPSLMALIAPNAMLMAALYTLDRLNGDSELIVMTAAGAPIWRIGAPFVLLASMVCVATLLLNSPLSVLSSVASPVTVTDSAALPTSSVASTRMVCAACTTRPDRTYFLKPETVTES